MGRTAAIVLLLALVATPALAQPSDSDTKRVVDAIGVELRREEVIPYKTPFVTVIGGFHSDVAGFGELRVGYGKGRHKRNILFPTITLWRVSAAVRGFYGRDNGVEASLLGGWGKTGPLGITIEGGVDARLNETRGVGPILAIGFRLGPFGVHTAMALHWGEEASGVFTVGIGYTLKDYIGPSEVAKERAKDEAKARGLPIP